MAPNYDGAPRLVNPSGCRYPAPMEPLTVDALRRLAEDRNLQLTGDELTALLPLVQAARALTDSLRNAPVGDAEPAGQYRVV